MDDDHVGSGSAANVQPFEMIAWDEALYIPVPTGQSKVLAAARQVANGGTGKPGDIMRCPLPKGMEPYIAYEWLAYVSDDEKEVTYRSAVAAWQFADYLDDRQTCKRLENGLGALLVTTVKTWNPAEGPNAEALEQMRQLRNAPWRLLIAAFAAACAACDEPFLRRMYAVLPRDLHQAAVEGAILDGGDGKTVVLNMDSGPKGLIRNRSSSQARPVEGRLWSAVCACLVRLSEQRQMTSLDLCCAGIPYVGAYDDEAHQLADTLGACTSLESLKIRGSWDGMDGSAITALALQRQLRHLKLDIDILDNSTLTSIFRGLQEIPALRGSAPKGLSIKGIDGMYGTFSSVFLNSGLSALTGLSFGKCNLEERDVPELADAVLGCPALRVFALIDEDLPGESSLTITRALLSHTSLEVLCFDPCRIAEEVDGVQELVQMLPAQLRVLGFLGPAWTPARLRFIAQAVPTREQDGGCTLCMYTGYNHYGEGVDGAPGCDLLQAELHKLCEQSRVSVETGHYHCDSVVGGL